MIALKGLGLAVEKFCSWGLTKFKPRWRFVMISGLNSAWESAYIVLVLEGFINQVLVIFRLV